MKYTFTLETAGSDASATTREKIVLESRAGESPRHIALKILAYLFFREAAQPLPLEIERAVGQRHKPDLVAREPDDGPICLWIDCGQIEPKRLGRIVAANPKARVIVLKSTVTEARLYARAAAGSVTEAKPYKRADGAQTVQIAGFGEGAIAEAIGALRGVNTLRASVVGETGGVLDWNGREIFAQISTFSLSGENSPNQ